MKLPNARKPIFTKRIPGISSPYFLFSKTDNTFKCCLGHFHRQVWYLFLLFANLGNKIKDITAFLYTLGSFQLNHQTNRPRERLLSTVEDIQYCGGYNWYYGWIPSVLWREAPSTVKGSPKHCGDSTDGIPIVLNVLYSTLYILRVKMLKSVLFQMPHQWKNLRKYPDLTLVYSLRFSYFFLFHFLSDIKTPPNSNFSPFHTSTIEGNTWNHWEICATSVSGK